MKRAAVDPVSLRLNLTYAGDLMEAFAKVGLP